MDSLNSIIIKALSDCVPIVGKYSDNIISIVLTGSFAREEGSVLIEASGDFRVLGDVEFIVITKENIDFRQISNLLRLAEKDIENILIEKGITCSVEFSPVTRNFFKKIRPTIFNYEFFLYGNVLYGDPEILNKMPEIRASLIPKYDAFFLLCNRIVEQLSVFSKLSFQKKYGVDVYYQLVKLYMDMAGSFLIITGRYEPSYGQRYKKFSQLTANDSFLSDEMFPIFLKRLEEMTRFKLNPEKIPDHEISNRNLQVLFYDSIKYVRKLWEWEIRFLANTGKFGSFEIKDYTALSKCLPLKLRIRGWLKFLWTAWKIKEPLSATKVFRLFLSGTPQLFIYRVAAELYFDLDQETDNNFKKLINFLPLKADVFDKQEAINVVVDAWNKFVRSA